MTAGQRAILSLLFLLAASHAAPVRLGVFPYDLPNPRLYFNETTGVYEVERARCCHARWRPCTAAAAGTLHGAARNLQPVHAALLPSAGYEAKIIEGLEEQGIDIELVRLGSLEERLTALEEGRVDASLSAISFSADRLFRIDVVRPFYYSAGTALFAPDGQVANVSKWTDVAGLPIAVQEGSYIFAPLASLGAQPILVSSQEEGVEAVNSGRAVAFAADNDAVEIGGLPIVDSLIPLAPEEWALAVRDYRSELSQRLGKALSALASGGAEAPLLQYEAETYGAAGVPPNRDLQELVLQPPGADVFLDPVWPKIPAVRWGVWAYNNPNPTSYLSPDGEWTGFEALVLQAINQTNLLPFGGITFLDSLDDRITALVDGEVDAVVGAFSVTPERKKNVTFVGPYYYSAGAGLYAPGGEVEGVSKWTDLAGKAVAVRPGYYANAALEAQGVDLVIVPDEAAAAEAIADGQAVAFVRDATAKSYVNGTLQLVEEPGTILRSPYAIAVRKDDLTLAQFLNGAMRELIAGGGASPLLKIEAEAYGKEGLPHNPDLLALVVSPLHGFLYPLNN